jgi:3-deoxy-D-manno-octulosonate 8-phosphate phosphatase (KDO 8-P phosphatase)
MLLSADAVAARARTVELLLFDVDGVLSDGSIVLRGDGAERKAFFVRDGAAIVWARRAGVQVGLLSGRSSEATSRRAAELGIELVVPGELDKLSAYNRILDSTGRTDAEVAYMGDDLLDLPVLGRAGLAAAPADAVAEVLARVHWISSLAGGRGAARDLIELVLRARGKWDALVRTYSGG